MIKEALHWYSQVYKSISYDAHDMVYVCQSVQFWKPYFPVNECIVNIGIPKMFFFGVFEIFLFSGSLWTRLLFIVGLLGTADMWQVICDMLKMTCDIWHRTCYTWHMACDTHHLTPDMFNLFFLFPFRPFLFVSVRLVSVLLAAHVKRFSVSRMGDFCSCCF